MDFTLPPEIDAIRLRTRAFVDSEIIPLESDPASYDAHENIALPLLERVRARAKAEGLWAPQTPRQFGGMGIGLMGQAAMYEEANRSIFGPACFNSAAPDDGNMMVLAKARHAGRSRNTGCSRSCDGEVRSAFVDDGASSRRRIGPLDDPHAGGATGGRLLRGAWHQMVHHRGGGSQALHPGRAYVGRSAPRA